MAAQISFAQMFSLQLCYDISSVVMKSRLFQLVIPWIWIFFLQNIS